MMAILVMLRDAKRQRSISCHFTPPHEILRSCCASRRMTGVRWAAG